MRPLLILLSTLALAQAARAQESIVVPAPTQPGEGRFTLGERFRYLRFDDDDRGTIDQYEAITTLQYGLPANLALSFELPVTIRDFEDRTLEGISDMTALIKWRVWQHDSSPVDTMRLGLSAGARFGSGHDDVSDEDVDPYLGAAFMLISGRHGFNVALDYTLTTGGGHERPIMPGDAQADYVHAGLAYLFRIAPEEYTADTDASWYAVLELSANYETNADRELFIAPGILYEARRWAAELSVLIPVAAQVDERPDTEIGVIAGLRFLF